jgi:hypothetical protein
VFFFERDGEVMNKTVDGQKTETKAQTLPRYEAPKIQAMSEKEILNSFQITQSMGVWWNIASC